MGSHFLPMFALLSLVLVVSHAALTSEVYWHSVLPNTPMPKTIQDLLKSDWTEEKSTSVNVGKGAVNVNTGKPGGGTGVNVGRKGVGVHTGKPGGGTTVGVGNGGVIVGTGHRDKPVYVGPFLYKYAASDDQLKDDPNVALFFLEKDLNSGKKMNLHFTKTTTDTTHLPRQAAEAIPFSSNRLPEILHQLSINPQSEKAEVIKQTIKECEEPAIEGEDKYCATSVESMIDFSTSKLGTNVLAMATEVEKDTQKQQYVISSGVKKTTEDKAVVCHGQPYPYAVFYCHATHTTRAYVVPLVGADGTKAKGVAVCHTDTSAWNPKHLAFKVLKVKPGTVPVCHFLPEDHLVWVQNQN